MYLNINYEDDDEKDVIVPYSEGWSDTDEDDEDDEDDDEET